MILRLTQDGEGEGVPVTLTATLPGGEEFSVTAHWWSREVYEQAARDAGFPGLSWITSPSPSVE
ncbi:MAG TPA: hypothetical protein VE196_09210 [Pseudonocardiaceae bacterium]|nr:hypothetical protein [Pseudonocardiaceae bacterium]